MCVQRAKPSPIAAVYQTSVSRLFMATASAEPESQPL